MVLHVRFTSKISRSICYIYCSFLEPICMSSVSVLFSPVTYRRFQYRHISHWMIGWRKILWYVSICLEGLRRIPKVLKMAGVQSEIRTENLTSTRLEPHHAANMFGRTHSEHFNFTALGVQQDIYSRGHVVSYPNSCLVPEQFSSSPIENHIDKAELRLFHK